MRVSHKTEKARSFTVNDVGHRTSFQNRDRVAELVAAGKMTALMSSNVREIREDAVAIETDNGPVILPNNAVIICAGGILPTGFLKDVGINVETKYGTA